MLEEIRTAIADQLNIPVETVNAESLLIDDLKADSIDIYELIMGLEERYGIEIYRRAIKDDNVTVYDTMKKEDPRRAIQLPDQVINAGIEANPR